MTELITTIEGLRDRLRASAPVAFVATMGALHEGHLALVRRAREHADTVVVSIFVNPLQFGEGEDFDRYPRDLDSDLAKLPAGTVVFAPSVEELYPDGEVETRIVAGEVGERYEGASRPGHFDGMLTVVAKLFSIVQPEVAVFGQKDGQQAFLVQRMVRDLNFPVTLDIVDTVREADGLAMSSRNRYLSDHERASARALSVALEEASRAGRARAARAAAFAVFAEVIGVDLDYFDIVDEETFTPVDDDFVGEALAIVAARVGTTRLIDNRRIRLAGRR